MLSTAKVVSFLATTDAARARAFYEGVLGLRVVSDDDFAMVVEGGRGDATIRVQKVKEKVTAPYTVMGWEVADAAAAVKELAARGVAFVRYEFMKQDEVGIWAAPGGAKVAWFQDPDGNVLSIAEHPGAGAGAGAGAGTGAGAGCPRCGTGLHWMTTARFGAHVCPSCHGMWVERTTWDSVVRLTEYMGRSELPRPDARELPTGGRDVACLVCRTTCARVLSWAGGVEVDTCAAHGLWFDRDELQTILDDIARGTRQARAGAKPAGGAAWATQANDVRVSESFVEVARGGGEATTEPSPPPVMSDAAPASRDEG